MLKIMSKRSSKVKFTYHVRKNGAEYWYFRRRIGGYLFQERLEGDPNKPEFYASYAAVLKRFEATKAPEDAIIPGTIRWVVGKYLKSDEFLSLKEKTKLQYVHFLNLLDGKNARVMVADLTRRDILDWIEDLRDQEKSSDHILRFFRIFRMLAGWCASRDMIKINPFDGLKPPRHKIEHHEPWDSDDIDKFIESDPPPAIALAFGLGLYTAARKADILAMQWADIEGNSIAVQGSKTDNPVTIPIHPNLEAMLERCGGDRVGHIIVNQSHQPYTADGFNTMWRRHIKKAGISKTMHGLRATAATMLFDAGCTVEEVQAITGHQTADMARQYGRKRNQVLLAKRAMDKLANPVG